jgi:hypothetical protein
MKIHQLNAGFNYDGQFCELAGCEPDARHFHKRFKPYCRTSTLRTGYLIEDVEAVEQLGRKILHRLEPGDLGVVTWSSHGTWEKLNDPTESSGGRQGLVMPNLSVLWDDRMAALFADRVEGSHVFAIIDACHPGSIQRGLRKPRSVPYRRCQQTRHVPSGLQTHALKGCWGFHGAGDGPTDYCYDAVFRGPEGAFSHYLLAALDTLRRGATYRDWFRLVGGRRPRGFLPSDDYPQSPVLVGSRANVTRSVPFV